MSNDQGPSFEVDNPIADVSQPKSKKKIWIFGSLLFLVLLGLIALFLVSSIGGPTDVFVNENISYIEASNEAAEALGAPVTAQWPGLPSASPENRGAIIFRGEVTGNNRSGTYVIEALMEGKEPERQSIYLEVEGEKIDLDPDLMFELDIDDGT